MMADDGGNVVGSSQLHSTNQGYTEKRIPHSSLLMGNDRDENSFISPVSTPYSTFG